MPDPIEEMKPFPNFHACRIAEPNGGKTRYAKNEREHEGKKYDVIYQEKSDGKWEDQSYRYSKKTWSAEEARTHCKSHDGSFEAASKEDSQEGPKGGGRVDAKTEYKIVQLKGLKLEESGSFRALFAPYDSIDKQGDMTMRGAFGEHQRVIISAYGHGSWTGALPVGKGFIHDGKDGGEVEGQFFLNTQAGKDTYTIVKELGDLQEWSYSLPEIDYEMRTIDNHTVRVLKRITVNEVSPVLMGAGNGTRTLAIKGEAVALTFAERMLKATIENEELYEILKGRRGFRASSHRQPAASDLKGAEGWVVSLDRLARALRETVERFKAFDEAKNSFEAMTKGE